MLEVRNFTSLFTKFESEILQSDWSKSLNVHNSLNNGHRDTAEVSLDSDGHALQVYGKS